MPKIEWTWENTGTWTGWFPKGPAPVIVKREWQANQGTWSGSWSPTTGWVTSTTGK